MACGWISIWILTGRAGRRTLSLERDSSKEMRMLDPVEKSDFYPVRAMTPVTLSIKIGNGQVGGTNVTFDGTPLGSGPITNLPIGTAGQDLKDKSVDCLTTVRRQNPSSGKTSVAPMSAFSVRAKTGSSPLAYATVPSAPRRASPPPIAANPTVVAGRALRAR